MAVPAPPGLPRIRDEVAGWEAEILAAGALPPRVVDAAVAALRELDHPETVVHGDLHDTNVLAAEREPWLAIDPKGLVGDPAYDAFTVIHSPRLLLTSGHLRALDIFCEAAGIDRERARRWALVRAVRSVLWGGGTDRPGWSRPVTVSSQHCSTERAARTLLLVSSSRATCTKPLASVV